MNQLPDILERSLGYSRKLLNKLREEGIMLWVGSSIKDPTQYYMLNIPKKL